MLHFIGSLTARLFIHPLRPSALEADRRIHTTVLTIAIVYCIEPTKFTMQNGYGMRPGIILLREGTDTSQVRV
jgi:hypothetical protein